MTRAVKLKKPLRQRQPAKMSRNRMLQVMTEKLNKAENHHFPRQKIIPLQMWPSQKLEMSQMLRIWQSFQRNDRNQQMRMKVMVFQMPSQKVG